MKEQHNNEYPVVSTTFWIVSSQNFDFEYLNHLFRINGSYRKKEDYASNFEEFAHAYWKYNIISNKVVSVEDEVQKVLSPFITHRSFINELTTKSDYKVSLTVVVNYAAETFLPLILFGETTINMIKKLNVSEFSLEFFEEQMTTTTKANSSDPKIE